MPPAPSPKKPLSKRPRGEARSALLDAAREEFLECGFEATDTNRIARRAGYAPQTFYRHFADKTAVFVTVYEVWIREELKALGTALLRKSGAASAASTILNHHRRFRLFRRSLRALAIVNPTVRAARTASRKHQAKALGGKAWQGLTTEQRYTALLAIERLADAAAEDELRDLGLSRAAEKRMLAALLIKLGVAEA